MASHCVGTVQTREELESGIRKREEMWFKRGQQKTERERGQHTRHVFFQSCRL